MPVRADSSEASRLAVAMKRLIRSPSSGTPRIFFFAKLTTTFLDRFRKFPKFYSLQFLMQVVFYAQLYATGILNNATSHKEAYTMKHFNVEKDRMEMIQCLEDAGEVPVLKRLQVRIHHSSHPPFKLKILPGTKVSDVLAYLNLDEDYVLCPISDPAKTFTPEEGLFDLISPDAKLVAKLSPEAEAKYAQLFMK
jgi:hypothetical protein